jgi:hypothetical protein
MPAGSDPAPGPSGPAPPALPRTWRAERTRRVVLVASILLVGTITAVAVLLPPDSGFTTLDRAAMVVVSLLFAAIMTALARSRVTATEDGLEIVNIIVKRRLPWAQVVAIRLGRNDPWLALDLDDGSTTSAFGIATSDGDRARRAAAELQQLLAAHSATPRDD